MNPYTYLQAMTSEDVQRLVRTALQFLAGALVSHGAISSTASWVEPTIGGAVFVATLGWQLYGNRLNAKIREIAKDDDTTVITSPERAAAINHESVVSSDTAQIVPAASAAQ